jgi:predicted AAA+ superfamily ATPase
MSLQFQRPATHILKARLQEPPGRMQIVAGPRQVGKTTLVRQVLNERPTGSYHMAAADDPLSTQTGPSFTDAQATSTATSSSWIVHHWQLAVQRQEAWERSGIPQAKELPFTLVLDEVQLVEQWSTTIKGLWDASVAKGTPMHVILLGSAPLLVQKGLQESLTGRYELIKMPHWSFAEMNEAFGHTLEEYIYFGGYPGSQPLMKDETRWRDYVRLALIEPSITKDVLALTRVDNPGLLRRLFEMGCEHSGQILALVRVSQSLQQGHTNTLADYLRLLDAAGLLTGLQKYAATADRQRRSPPKFQVKNNALMSALGFDAFAEAQNDRTHWGRMVESCVGAHLINTADADTEILYWREGDLEVDFVVERRGRLAAIEVKSSPRHSRHPGLEEFCRRHPNAKPWLVGSDELPLGEFLQHDAGHWTV